MSVEVGYILEGERCEACEGVATRQDPVLTIVGKGGQERRRGDRDIVWIHRSCLSRKIDRTLARIERDHPNVAV